MFLKHSLIYFWLVSIYFSMITHFQWLVNFNDSMAPLACYLKYRSADSSPQWPPQFRLKPLDHLHKIDRSTSTWNPRSTKSIIRFFLFILPLPLDNRRCCNLFHNKGFLISASKQQKMGRLDPNERKARIIVRCVRETTHCFQLQTKSFKDGLMHCDLLSNPHILSLSL